MPKSTYTAAAQKAVSTYLTTHSPPVAVSHADVSAWMLSELMRTPELILATNHRLEEIYAVRAMYQDFTSPIKKLELRLNKQFPSFHEAASAIGAHLPTATAIAGIRTTLRENQLLRNTHPAWMDQYDNLYPSRAVPPPTPEKKYNKNFRKAVHSVQEVNTVVRQALPNRARLTLFAIPKVGAKVNITNYPSSALGQFTHPRRP